MPHQVGNKPAARSFGLVGTRPNRAILVNRDLPLESVPGAIPRALEFMLNPDQLKYHMAAEWARIAVPGLSHEVLQYSHSASTEVSFDIEWSSQEAARRFRSQEQGRPQLPTEEARAIRAHSRNEYFRYHEFLGLLTVPIDRGFAPSRVALIWPNFMRMTAAVVDVDFTFQQWSVSGEPMRFVVALELVEARTSFRRRLGRTSVFQDLGDEDSIIGQQTSTNAGGSVLV